VKILPFLIISASLSLAACGTTQTVTQTVPVRIEVNPALRTPCVPASPVPQRITDDVFENRDRWRAAFEVCSAQHDALIAATEPTTPEEGN
jgi:hypothetical protein